MFSFLRPTLIGLLIATSSHAQSSSSFSGLFGAADDDFPVEVTIEGADGIEKLDREIRNASLIYEALEDGRVLGSDLLAAARTDYARILGILYDHGRFDAVINIRLDGVEAATIAPFDVPEAIADIDIVIEPGPQFIFSRTAISPIAPATQLPEDFHVGADASTGLVKNAARAAVTGWREASYAKAKIIDNTIVADHPARALAVDIALNPGPPLRFGRLQVSGQTKIEAARVTQIAGLPSGTSFDPRTVELVRRRLRRTGVFSAITLTEAEEPNSDGTLDMDLTLIERKPRRIGAGIEASNTRGLGASVYWLHRNLLGGAERLEIEGRVTDVGANESGIDTTAKIRLSRPSTLHPDVNVFSELTLTRERQVDYDATIGSFSIGATYIRDDVTTANAALEYRRSRITDPDGQRDFELLALPLDVTLDRREPLVNPVTGYWLQLEATPFLGLDEEKQTGDGARLVAEGRAYRGFGEENKFVLAGRGRIGTILGSDLDRTPRDYLFYSGGGGTVRGQPFQSLGVEALQGGKGPIRTGGASLATVSAELRYNWNAKIAAVAFADMGKVWAENSFQGESDHHAGAGLGLRYNTSIGPLRLDLAAPISGDTGDGIQIYLGLGQAF